MWRASSRGQLYYLVEMCKKHKTNSRKCRRTDQLESTNRFKYVPNYVRTVHIGTSAVPNNRSPGRNSYLLLELNPTTVTFIFFGWYRMKNIPSGRKTKYPSYLRTYVWTFLQRFGNLAGNLDRQIKINPIVSHSNRGWYGTVQYVTSNFFRYDTSVLVPTYERVKKGISRTVRYRYRT